MVVGAVLLAGGLGHESAGPAAAVDLAAEGAPVTAPAVTCDAGGRFAVGVVVDCVVDVGSDSSEDLLWAVGLVDQDGSYWPCEAKATESYCSGIGKERFDLERRQLSLELSYETAGLLQFADAAVIESAFDQDPRFSVFVAPVEPVVFDGRPLPVEIYADAEVGRMFLIVRTRHSGEVVDTVELTVPAVGELRTTPVALDAPPGRYRVWVCEGADETSCDERPGGYPVQVIDPEIRELVPGHNRRSAERINIVFAGSQLGSSDDLVSVATTLLTLDGPETGLYDLHHGPMAIEPLASNQDKFNFWYLVEPVGDERSLLTDGTEPDALDGFDLPNMAITVLYGPGYGASDARFTSLWNLIDAPPADQIRFGGARVSVDVDDPLTRAATLAHEWGHSLFELRDEYVGFDDREVLNQYPNCAPTAALADDWWGTLDGAIDPFVYEVLRARRAAGFTAEPRDGERLADSVRVGVYPGGCYGAADATTAYRPSQDSLMNSEIPVWGAVNRRRVEQVLARFSGRGPLDDLEDVELSCERDSGVVACDGFLATFLDPPVGRVTLEGKVCGLMSPVDPSSADVAGRSTISCEAPSTSGAVTLSFAGRDRLVPVVDVPAPAPVAPSDPVGEPVPEAEPGNGFSFPFVSGGILAVLVLARVVRATWRRQK